MPRVPANGAFCTELVAGVEGYAMVSDLSPSGLRLHRPYRGRRGEVIQLEFDLPGVDEVIWAKGVVCFDRIWRPARNEPMLFQTTGVRIAAAAASQLKLLKEYAFDLAPQFRRYSERRVAVR